MVTQPMMQKEQADKLAFDMERLPSPDEHLNSFSPDELAALDWREILEMRKDWAGRQSNRLLMAVHGQSPGSMAHVLSGLVTPSAGENLRNAFAGNLEAAEVLLSLLETCESGVVAYAMWKAKVPSDVFLAYLGDAWAHAHRYVIMAARTRRRLAAMFRYADFPKPPCLPDSVRVWRGASHMTKKRAQAGYSWTTDRDVACWFACNGGPPGRVFVLAADVPKQDISLFFDGRYESEVVLLKPPESWIVGNLADWEAASERHMREKEKRHRTANALTDEGRQARSATDRADPTA